MAWACTAFARARTIKPPAHLVQVVVLDGGVDTPGRAVAGQVPARAGPITEHAAAERWRACGPWGNAVLRPLLPRPWVATLPHALRVGVIDARRRQAPGAPGTDERLPISKGREIVRGSRGVHHRGSYGRNAEALGGLDHRVGHFRSLRIMA